MPEAWKKYFECRPFWVPDPARREPDDHGLQVEWDDDDWFSLQATAKREDWDMPRPFWDGPRHTAPGSELIG